MVAGGKKNATSTQVGQRNHAVQRGPDLQRLPFAE